MILGTTGQSHQSSNVAIILCNFATNIFYKSVKKVLLKERQRNALERQPQAVTG